MKTEEEWFQLFDVKEYKYCVLQANCIPYNSKAFGAGLKRAIAKKKKSRQTYTTPKIKYTTVKTETDPDILAGTHEWVTQNLESGAGKGARHTVVVKCKI